MAKQSRGQCAFCKQTYAKGGITRHLQACQAREEAQAAVNGRLKPARLFHLVAEGLYDPDYWLHLEIPASLTLEELDQFLRDIWLECCGHLSMFEIAGQRYTQIFDDGFFSEDKPMTAKLGQVFSPGLEMEYEYDFGSSTLLKLKVMDERSGKASKKGVQIMARNTPPDIRCVVCGKPATQVCALCIYEGTGWVCDEHTKNHECGDEYFLPVVNSPRVGVCAYTGEAGWA